ncbi:hypothetical protein [Chitinophaga sp.]|uniref:hypothetical protein n=1 Tax=Chitinophaga sp. TaxID=1869181 RepID=UPI0031D6247B
MLDIPFYIPFTFMLTTFAALFFFYRAGQSAAVLYILLLWLALQGILARSGFYTVTDTRPPRFLLLVLPLVLGILLIFLTRGGRAWMNGLDYQRLTWLHVVRVPVELVLFWLYGQQLVPALITFEGRNFDILSGLTAPFIAWYGYMRPRLPRGMLIGWNLFCMALLLNVVIHAILSAPTPIQQLAFDQPNRAVLYFPFVWLPGCIVPLVLFSHLAAIRALIKKNELPEHGI